jgi:protein TonB
MDQLIDETGWEPINALGIQSSDLPAASPPPDLKEPDVPLIWAEQMPRFPGCDDVALSDEERKLCSEKRLLQFLTANIHYPNHARDNGVEGLAIIRFVVGKDGHIHDAMILCDPGGGTGAEALRVINLMLQEIIWVPGRHGGQPVSVQFNLPVKFTLK